MADLVSVFEREIELRSSGDSFPHSLWASCKEAAREHPLAGGSKTMALYREALIAVADASGKKLISKEYVAEALRLAREHPRMDKVGTHA